MKQRSKTLSEKLCEFSASISFDSFIEHLDVLFFMHKRHEVLRPMSLFLLEKHAQALLPLALTYDMKEKAAIISSSQDLLLQYPGSIALTNTIEVIIHRYLETIKETVLTEDQTYDLTILSAMCSLLLIQHKQKEKNKAFCLNMLPYISGENFHLRTDDLFIKSYPSIVLGAESFHHFGCLF
jgi:uncharacterized membrane protein YheB (UPF0754 family)